MKIVNKYTTLLSLCAAFAACNDNEVLTDNPSTGGETGEKTPIVLSINGVEGPITTDHTRAVVTDNPYEPKKFTKKTTINFVMKSDKVGGTEAQYCITRGVIDPTSNEDIVDFGTNAIYWDDTFARDAAVSIWAYTAQGTNWGNFLVGDKSAVSNWGTDVINPTIATWKVSDNSNISIQTSETIVNQDLIFSNNVADYSANTEVPESSRNDNRLKFNNKTSGKFDKADLKFYHAMSMITVNLVAGKGFESSPFAITTATDITTPANGNVIINDMNMAGTFDIMKGEFSAISDNTSKIAQMWNTTNTVQSVNGKKTWTLKALAIPFLSTGTTKKSTFKKDDQTIMMQFGIDNNVYNVTQAVLFSALTGKDGANTISGSDEYIQMEAGKNYVFTFIIGKKQIENITAQVAEWETVTANEVEPSNARIKLNLEERGTTITTNSSFYFYRSTQSYTETDIKDDFAKYDWKTGYKDSGNGDVQTTPTFNNTDSHWTTDWHWESNKHFYHFRALGVVQDNTQPSKLSLPGNSVETEAAVGDYINITSAKNYIDLCWGAPFKDVEQGNEVDDHENLKWNYGPTVNGFDGKDGATAHQIYKAIGPTEDPVKLIMFHMMSDVTFNIKTTTGADKVTLVDNSDTEHPKYPKVEIVGFYPNGKVLLGNGLVKTTDNTPGTSEVVWNLESPSGTHIYKYGVVPQDLATTVNGEAGVQLRITTPDNNQYIVDLKDALVSSNNITNYNIANPYTETGQNTGKYKIDRWYPGFKYNYTFTLAKTGITNLQATIVNWETVTADDETVQIR